MKRINSINPQEATGITKILLDDVQKKLGMTPSMMRGVAQSPAVLEGYLDFSGALADGELSAKLREQIALIPTFCERLSNGKLSYIYDFQLLNRRTA